VCCSVLQCVAVYYSVLQCAATFISTVHSNCVLQCVAVCCSVLQCITVYCSVLQRLYRLYIVNVTLTFEVICEGRRACET